MITSGRPCEFNRQKVIEAAMELFWLKGYKATSTQELCEYTGLGKGSLYNAFGNKQGLYQQALEYYHELAIKTQLDILNGPGLAKEKLRALLQWGINADLDRSEPRTCMALFSALELSRQDPIVERLNRIYSAKLEQALFHLFELGQRSGEIKASCPALEMSRAFLGSYYGLRIMGQTIRDKHFLRDVLNGTLAAL